MRISGEWTWKPGPGSLAAFMKVGCKGKTDGWKEQIPGLDPQGREPSSGRLISTRARAYKVQAESQVDTEQAIVGRVGRQV